MRDAVYFESLLLCVYKLLRIRKRALFHQMASIITNIATTITTQSKEVFGHGRKESTNYDKMLRKNNSLQEP